MQPRLASVLAAAALHVVFHGGAALTLTAAESRASSWLRAHGSGAPQADDLAELKTENPEAYGLVKALLMKRSLGLLDPRHPSASFAAAKAPVEDVPGAEAFEKIAEESGEKPKAAALYPDAPMPEAHHNWLSWKPAQSADDEAMVSNVLGSVAQLKAGASSEAGSEAGSKVDELKWSNPTDTPAVKPLTEQSASSPATPSQENPYLQGLDLDGGVAASQAAPVRPPSIGDAAQSSGNFLTSFSWDDKQPAARPQAEVVAQSSSSQGKQPMSALLNWLTSKKGA